MTLRRYLRLHAPTARGAAVRAAEVARALDPRRAPGCPPSCSEGHTDVWPCEVYDEGPRVALSIRLAERGALLDAVAEALACHRCDAPIGGRCAVPGGYASPCRYRRPAPEPTRVAGVDPAVAEPRLVVGRQTPAGLRIEVSPALREAMDNFGTEVADRMRTALADVERANAARLAAQRTHPDRTGRLR